MRILLSFLQALKPHPISSYRHWETYLKKGIEEGGHFWTEVSNTDWAEALTITDEIKLDGWRERTWSRTLDFLQQEMKSAPVDLFLSYLYPKMVDSSAISEIQRLGVPCVNFFCDNVRDFRKVPSEFHCFDLNWVPEYQALAMYKKAGLKHFHAPMPCWVAPEHRTCSHPETQTVTFIGSPGDQRRHLMGQAIQLGADISIYGMGWQGDSGQRHNVEKNLGELLVNQLRHVRQHGVKSWFLKFERRFLPLSRPSSIPPERLLGKLSPGDYVRVMQQSSIALGINRMEGPHRALRNPITYSRLRDVEAPMMGACYLTEWAEDLEHLYDLGTEIETYRSAKELVRKIAELRADSSKRRRLRRAGQMRALSELSIPASLRKIAKALGIVLGPKSDAPRAH